MLTKYSNVHAERAVLGACLVWPEVLGGVADKMKPEDLLGPGHGPFFSVLMDIFIENPKLIESLPAVYERAERAGVGNLVWELYDSASHSPEQALAVEMPIILDHSRRRKVALKVDDLSKAELDDVKRIAGEIMTECEPEGEVILAPNKIEFAIPDRTVRENGRIPTGIETLGRAVDIFREGTLNVIAARPSQGKTTLLREIVLSASQKEHVMVCPLEESPQVFHERLVCSEARVEYARFYAGLPTQEERVRLGFARERVNDLKLSYVSKTSLDAKDVLILSRSVKPRVLAIDYLGLMIHHTGKQSLVQAIGETTRLLKICAMELNLSVLLLCQLNREVEKREEGKPNLSDLRDSGAIEQDADSVIFIYGDKSAEGSVCRKTVIVAKNRYGPTSKFEVNLMRNEGRVRAMSMRRDDDSMMVDQRCGREPGED